MKPFSLSGLVLIVFGVIHSPCAQQQASQCFQQGRKLFEEKKYRESIRVLEKCSDDSRAWEPLGLAYFELSYMDDAKIYLKKAIEKDPANIRLKSTYADAYAYNREFKKAIDEFRVLLKEHPYDTTIQKGLAQALGWNKQFDEAITLYRDVIKKNPQDFESRIQVGVLTSWDKKFKEAVAEFRTILEEKPSQRWEIAARLRMAEVISWQKKFPEAIAEYANVKKSDPAAVDAYLGTAQVLEWQGKYKDARKEYEKALQIDPQNEKAKGLLQQLMWVK